MKNPILLSAAALLICGFATSAFATEVLDDAKCGAAWTMASPHGETISKDQAVPYVIDDMVDSARTARSRPKSSRKVARRAR